MKTNTTLAVVATFLTVIVFASTPNAHAALFDVYAKANSYSDGHFVSTINLVQGEGFTVSANPNDLWCLGEINYLRWGNADGLYRYLYATGTDDSGRSAGAEIGRPEPLMTEHGLTAVVGMLVGKIGNSYIALGTSYTGTAPETGVLELMCWDGNSFDNLDKISANVSAVPEPSTYVAGALLAIPLGLSWARRSRNKKIEFC